MNCHHPPLARAATLSRDREGVEIFPPLPPMVMRSIAPRACVGQNRRIGRVGGLVPEIPSGRAPYRAIPLCPRYVSIPGIAKHRCVGQNCAALRPVVGRSKKRPWRTARREPLTCLSRVIRNLPTMASSGSCFCPCRSCRRYPYQIRFPARRQGWGFFPHPSHRKFPCASNRVRFSVQDRRSLQGQLVYPPRNIVVDERKKFVAAFSGGWMPLLASLNEPEETLDGILLSPATGQVR